MSTTDNRKSALIIAICIAALIPLRMLGADTSAPPFQASACGAGQQAADRLQADLGLDRAMLERARTISDAAARSGQAAPADHMQSLGEDTADGLADAADQMDSTAQDVNTQLDRMQLARQSRAWSRGLNTMRSAKNEFKRAVEGIKRPNAPGRTPFGDATGVGPRVLYGAANNLQQAVDALHTIQQDAQLQSLGGAGLPVGAGAQRSGIQPGARDTPPPPNPVPSPAEELNRLLARMNALNARVRANGQALQGIQQLAAGDFNAANRRMNEMQNGLDQAGNFLGQLRNALSSCPQQQPSQGSNTAAPSATPAAAAAAKSGGGGMGGGAALLAAGVAAAGGYAIYKATMTCSEPDLTANTNSCGSGSCGACVALLEQIQTFCDCGEEIGELPAGICSDFRNEVINFRNTHCLNPKMLSVASEPRR